MTLQMELHPTASHPLHRHLFFFPCDALYPTLTFTSGLFFARRRPPKTSQWGRAMKVEVLIIATWLSHRVITQAEVWLSSDI